LLKNGINKMSDQALDQITNALNQLQAKGIVQSEESAIPELKIIGLKIGCC
jgi:hypothetical protein